jgi:hypothetical protein
MALALITKEENDPIEKQGDIHVKHNNTLYKEYLELLMSKYIRIIV